MTTLCVITPTLSRPTLHRALTSTRLTADDEWLVIGDGPQPEAERVCRELRILPYLRYVQGPEMHDWGNSQRDFGMGLSTRDYFLFLDDDDVFVPGAIQAIRDQLNGKPFIFRVWHNGNVIWTSRGLHPGNVVTGAFVLPNQPDKLARWADDQNYASDVTFMERTMDLWEPTDLIWAGELIQIAKPETSEEWKHLA